MHPSLQGAARGWRHPAAPAGHHPPEPAAPSRPGASLSRVVGHDSPGGRERSLRAGQHGRRHGRDRGGGPQIYRLSVGAAKVERVTFAGAYNVSPSISPDGKTLAVSGDGLQLWSTATGQRIGATLSTAEPASPAAFSPDGTLVAAVGADGRARVWNVASQRETGAAANVASHAVLAFSPGGKTFATAGADGTAALWSVATGHRIGLPMTAGPREAAPGQPASVAFSPDGHTLAVAGADGSTWLWDVATQQEIGTPMTAGPAPVYALAFSSDGTTLATAASGVTRRWDVAFPAGLPAGACAIAGQTLTPRQWAGYAGIEPFQQVCPAS